MTSIPVKVHSLPESHLESLVRTKWNREDWTGIVAGFRDVPTTLKELDRMETALMAEKRRLAEQVEMYELALQEIPTLRANYERAALALSGSNNHREENK